MTVPTRTSGTAIASLVTGIASWVVVPVIGALVAVICGHLARSEIRRMPANTIDGDGIAVAGLILGYANLALSVLVVVGVLLLIAFGLSAGHWN